MDDELTAQEAAELEEFVHIAVSIASPMLDELFADIEAAHGSEMAHFGVFTGIIGSCFNKMKELDYNLAEALQLAIGNAVDVYSEKRGLH